jgi:CCGSCS motif protein
MAGLFVKMFKKDDKQTETKEVETVEASEAAKPAQDEAEKDKHGKGTCCGSCS